MAAQVFCGAFLGFVLGALAEIIITCLLERRLPDGDRFPVVCASVGAALFACIGLMVGDYELNGRVKLLLIGDRREFLEPGNIEIVGAETIVVPRVMDFSTFNPFHFCTTPFLAACNSP